MGWSDFWTDMDALAAARRGRFAPKQSARGPMGRTALRAKCKLLVDEHAGSGGGLLGKSSAVIPKMDGYSSEVVPMVEEAHAFSAAIRGATSLATATRILVAYGFRAPIPFDLDSLKAITEAAENLARASRSLTLTWPVSGDDSRSESAREVSDAARMLLALTEST